MKLINENHVKGFNLFIKRVKLALFTLFIVTMLFTIGCDNPKKPPANVSTVTLSVIYDTDFRLGHFRMYNSNVTFSRILLNPQVITLNEVPFGDYEIEIILLGFETDDESFKYFTHTSSLKVQKEKVEHSIILTPTLFSTVNITVLTDNEEVGPDALITLINTDVGFPILFLPANHSGTQTTFEIVPYGTYELSIVSLGYQTHTETINVQSETVNIEIELERRPFGSVNVYIRTNDGYHPNGLMTLRNTEEPLLGSILPIDTTNQIYTFLPVPYGTYELNIVSLEYQTHTETINVQQLIVPRIVELKARLQSTVNITVNTDDNRPPFAMITLLPTEEILPPFIQPADEDGETYTFVVPHGTYELSIVSLRYQLITRTINVQANTVNEVVDLIRRFIIEDIIME